MMITEVERLKATLNVIVAQYGDVALEVERLGELERKHLELGGAVQMVRALLQEAEKDAGGGRNAASPPAATVEASAAGKADPASGIGPRGGKGA